jgi:LPXTG-motif cell wall-anchored protein
MTEETVFLEEGSIRITNLRAIFGPKTYPVSYIASVSMVEKAPDPAMPIIFLFFLLLVLAIFLMMGFVLSFVTGDTPWTIIILGVLLFALAGLMLPKRKTRYIVQIASASGDTTVLDTTDRRQSARVVIAINKAIIQDGLDSPLDTSTYLTI